MLDECPRLQKQVHNVVVPSLVGKDHGSAVQEGMLCFKTDARLAGSQIPDDLCGMVDACPHERRFPMASGLVRVEAGPHQPVKQRDGMRVNHEEEQ